MAGNTKGCEGALQRELPTCRCSEYTRADSRATGRSSASRPHGAPGADAGAGADGSEKAVERACGDRAALPGARPRLRVGGVGASLNRSQTALMRAMVGSHAHSRRCKGFILGHDLRRTDEGGCHARYRACR